MSLRISIIDWISGDLVIGETGLGVLAENVPSTGTDGASVIYNDISLPADNGKEVRILVLAYPSAGTLFVYEDGSFSFVDAPDGTYTFTYQLYVDGVETGGPATVTLNVGSTMSADGVVVSTCTASLTTGIVLGADSFSVSTSSASLTTVINLASAAIALASSSSELTTSITLQASVNGSATASAVLEDSPATQLDASGSVISTATATLTTGIVLAALAQANATGTASLTVIGGTSIGAGEKLTITFVDTSYNIKLVDTSYSITQY